MMGTTGVRIFNNMLSAAGNFGSGVVSVLTQLAPLADWAAAGFKRMGQAFNFGRSHRLDKKLLDPLLNILNRTYR